MNSIETIEEFVVLFLSGRLDAPVSGDIPSPLPERFVTVEQTASGWDDGIKSATLAVQSWAASRASAARLNRTVEEAMEEINAEDEISLCVCSTSYNFPDTARRRPRYQAVFEITHFF